MRLNIVAGFFLPVPPVQGGAMEKIWSRLAVEFSKQGHQVTYISRRWPSFPDDEVIEGVRHLRLKGMAHTRHLSVNLLLDFLWSLRVARALPAADFTLCNTVALPAWLGRVCSKPGRVVAVVARMPKGQGKLYGKVDAILSFSAAVTARLVSENPALAHRIVPFPGSIDWALHASTARRISKGPVVRIGYIGRINPEKGIDLFLEALSRLAGNGTKAAWSAVMIGPVAIPSGGGGEPWLKSLLAHSGDRVRDRLEVLPPIFDPAKLAEQYAKIDIFVYPSLAEKGETFGVAVAEAMAAGCAPVVSALDCFNELVSDGTTGFVFNHHSGDRIASLALILARLVDDPSLRRSVGEKAQAWTRQFDYGIAAPRLLEQLSSISTDGLR